jgi:plastocyanin
MSRGTIIGIVIAVVVLVGVAFAVTRPKPTPAATTNSPSATASSPSPAASSAAAAATTSATITYKSGFSPAMTTVKSGQTITFKNESTEEIEVNSDPHPTHTDDTDLNVGAIAPGQSKTVTVTKVGAFGFHNHLDPTEKGNITIQ